MEGVSTKTVSTQDMAPYPRREVQNSRGEQTQDFDELASEASNSKQALGQIFVQRFSESSAPKIVGQI